MNTRKERRQHEAQVRKILKKVKSGDWVKLLEEGNLGQPIYACMHESKFDHMGGAMATVYNPLFGEDCAEMGMVHSSTHYAAKRLSNDEVLDLIPAGVLSLGVRNQKLAVSTGEAF